MQGWTSRARLAGWEWWLAGTVSVAATLSLLAFLVVSFQQSATAVAAPCGVVGQASTACACSMCTDGRGQCADDVRRGSWVGDCRQPVGATAANGSRRCTRTLVSTSAPVRAPSRRLTAPALASGVVLLWLLSLLLIGSPLAPWRQAWHAQRRSGAGAEPTQTLPPSQAKGGNAGV